MMHYLLFFNAILLILSSGGVQSQSYGYYTPAPAISTPSPAPIVYSTPAPVYSAPSSESSMAGSATTSSVPQAIDEEVLAIIGAAGSQDFADAPDSEFIPQQFGSIDFLRDSLLTQKSEALLKDTRVTMVINGYNMSQMSYDQEKAYESALENIRDLDKTIGSEELVAYVQP